MNDLNLEAISPDSWIFLIALVFGVMLFDAAVSDFKYADMMAINPMKYIFFIYHKTIYFIKKIKTLFLIARNEEKYKLIMAHDEGIDSEIARLRLVEMCPYCHSRIHHEVTPVYYGFCVFLPCMTCNGRITADFSDIEYLRLPNALWLNHSELDNLITKNNNPEEDD